MIGYWHDTSVRSSVCLSVSVSLSRPMTKCIVALRLGVGVESGTVMILGGPFLFTSSGHCCYRMYRLATFTVGCIVQSLCTAKKNENSRVSNSHGQRGRVTMAIPDAALSAVRFCSYILRHTQYDRSS